MASIKVKYRPSVIKDSEGTIYYQIIHERKVKSLTTDYKVFPSEWDSVRSMVRTTQDSDRKPFILAIRDRIRWDVARINKIIRTLEDSGVVFSLEDIQEEFIRYEREYTLFSYMERSIVRLKQNSKIRTAETYTVTLNSFKRFRDDKDIMLECMTAEIMEEYEAWLKRKGISLNTISFYIRIIRAVYNRAVDEEVIENRFPFRRVYTGIEKTIKRALPLPIIKKIKRLDLSFCPNLDFARDMFLLSFYLRGMSFIDMAFMRKTDLKSGYIIYRRRKTGQMLTIKWTNEMNEILSKYPENDSDYLFPIIKRKGLNERCTYRNMGYNINRNLKKIAQRLDLDIPLTLYVARHSWASAARTKGIPVSIISEGMGHDSESTTKIYLASLDTAIVDKANTIILKSLR